jgi:hypothetical protein
VNLLECAADLLLCQLHAVVLGAELELLGEGNLLQAGSATFYLKAVLWIRNDFFSGSGSDFSDGFGSYMIFFSSILNINFTFVSPSFQCVRLHNTLGTVLRIRCLFCPLDPEIKIRIPDEHLRTSLMRIRIRNTFDPGSGMKKV